MAGDDRVRFCGECRKNVYDLRGMRREEAEGLLRERGGDLCVRLYRRADGTVLTEDCPVGAEQKPPESEPRVRMGRFLPPSFEQLLRPVPKPSPRPSPKPLPKRRLRRR
jgi:hypothetical protein